MLGTNRDANGLCMPIYLLLCGIGLIGPLRFALALACATCVYLRLFVL